MNEPSGLLALKRAWEILDTEASRLNLDVEMLPVMDARNRFLAEDQFSILDLPPFDKSAMDGYAVLENDNRDEYRLLGIVAAGEPCGFTLEPGTTVKVMTGAPVPQGAGAVIKVEDAAEQDGAVRIQHRDSRAHICLKGEDITVGRRIASKGDMLDPAGVANLLSCGVERVNVFRPVRIAIISTGDELVESPSAITPGKIIDSNSPLLHALSRECGFEITYRGHADDNLEDTRSVLELACNKAEFIVTSGGVSMGDFDVVPAALRQLGFELLFDRLAVKPGRPMTFGVGRGKLFFGLPGNPVGVFLMFHLCLLRAVRIMSGADPQIRTALLPLAEGIPKVKTQRTQYVPCRLTAEGTLEKLEYHGSAHLLALNRADGFLILSPQETGWSAGEKVEFFPIRYGVV